MKLQIREAIAQSRSKGLFHIVVSSSLVKIVSFISAMFLPRILTKADYGLLTYVDNIRNYILLINALGISNATLRYCARQDSPEKRKGYFLASILLGLAIDIILIILSVICFLLVPLPFAGARPLLLLMSVLPLLAFLFEDLQLFLRACFENFKYSLLSFTYAFAMVALQIVLAIFYGLSGVVYARYIAILLCLAAGIFMLSRSEDLKVKAIYPDKKQLLQIFKFGVIIMFTNAASLVMQLNETFIIGQILKNEDQLAEYKVASYILTISLFLTQSVVIFIFPHFVRHMDNKIWIWSRFKKISLYNAALMIPLHALLIIFSRPFILLIFGDKYENSIPIMQMLLVASLFQSLFRGIAGNILAGIGEERFNLKLNIIFVIIHALIDIWAIRAYGIRGAAIALTAVYFLSGMIMVWHLRKVCRVSPQE